MTEEEKLKVYKEGYKDGYNDAVKFYIIEPRINTRPDTYKCPVCGKSDLTFQVCYDYRCPSRITYVETKNNTTEWK